MFLRDRPSSGSAETFSAAEEIQPRGELPTNCIEDPLARRFSDGVELRHLGEDFPVKSENVLMLAAATNARERAPAARSIITRAAKQARAVV